MDSLVCVLLVSLCGADGEPAATPQTVAGLQVAGVSGGTVTEQSMQPFPLGTWQAGDQLWWQGGRQGDKLDLVLPVQTDGTYDVAVVLTRAADYAIVQFRLDGQRIGKPLDLFAAYVTATPPIPLGTYQLAAGDHVLSVEILGANSKARPGLLFGIDRIEIRPARALPPSPPDATAAWEPLARLEMLPRVRPGTRTGMFSSYDRTGGNNDGFSGMYSQLWIEDGQSVLASMEGAGCIQRIWFTHSEFKTPGLLNLKQEHIRISIDGSPNPVLDVPLEDLFSGRLARFPSPLVGEGLGGYYCYVPIPYRNGCRVMVEGTGVRFYQITYREFASAEGVASWSQADSAAEAAAQARAVAFWSAPGEISGLNLLRADELSVDLELTTEKPQVVELPPGPRMVRAVIWEGVLPGVASDGASGRFEMVWDNAAVPAVDVPVVDFFGQALDPPPYRSLLVGNTEQGYYNFLPMPYRQSGRLVVRSDVAGKARLRVWTTPLEQWDPMFGHFHARYEHQAPVPSDQCHPWLRREGQGHYVGTYLVTRGKTDRKLPLWLEGDDRFTVDGVLVSHGTGSEDYFNGGWYAVPGRLNGPGARPVHGFPVYRLAGDENQAVAYRWHLTDPVHYDRSIRAEIEHGGDNRQEADYASVAYYYELPASE